MGCGTARGQGRSGEVRGCGGEVEEGEEEEEEGGGGEGEEVGEEEEEEEVVLGVLGGAG